MSQKKIKLAELVENYSVRAKDILNEKDINNLKFLGVSNEEGITFSKYAAEDKAEEYKIIEKGCFAYNPYRINVGSIGLMEDDDKGLISPAYVVFKTKPKRIKEELLLRFLKSDEGLRQIKLNARGTVRQALRFEDLCNIEISIPDFSEQGELLNTLNTIRSKTKAVSDELISQKDLLKQLRQAFLREAMQGKLVPQNPNDEPASELLKKIKAEKERIIKKKKLKKEKPLTEIKEEEIPYEIPKSWIWCRLGEMGKFRRGPFGSSLTKGIFVKKGYKVYEQKNAIYDNHTLGDYYITKEKYEEMKSFRVFPKDLIVSCSGATLGRIAEIPNVAKEGIINQALMRISLERKIISNAFFIKLFRSPYMQENIFEKAWGTAIPNMVGLVEIKKIPIPLPPIPEQQRIVTKLEQLMKFCDELEQSIKESKEQTNLLLQSALREALTAKNN